MSITWRHPTVWRWMTLFSYFGLILLLLAWVIAIAPPTTLPKSLVLIIAVVPWLLPLRGLLHGRRYTHAWASFLCLPYFAFGVDAAVHSAHRSLGVTLALLSLLLFSGCVFYARFSTLQHGRAG